MNTATARTAAREAEKAHNWAEAARLYDVAIAAYRPMAGRTTLGELAMRDIAMMADRAAAARSMLVAA